MNYFFAILLILGSASSVLAQPVITGDIQPQPGDECRYLSCNIDSFIHFPAPDQYWDLSGLPFQPSTHVLYALPDTTAGFAYFPEADVAFTTSAFFFYEYYDTSPSAWTVIGAQYISTEEIFGMVDPMVVMPFPWTYGTDWEDPYSYTDGEGTMYEDTMRWEASTYGTMRLPGGTELEVAGMVTTEVDVDTIMGTEDITETVWFYSPGLRCRVATIRTWISFVPGFPMSVNTNISVLDDATIGMAENTVSDALELWPLPATSTLHMHWEGATGNATAQVFDAAGRMQLTTTMSHAGAEMSMDVSTLAPGHYVLRVNNGQRILAKPFIVE